MEFTNTTLLYGLFNQYVLSEAKMNWDLLSLYYQNSRVAGNNSLVEKLLNLIKTYSYKDLTDSRFYLTLQKDGKSDEEIKMIYDKIKEFQGYTKEQAGVFIENLKIICTSAYFERLHQWYGDDPIKYSEEAVKFRYKSNYSSHLYAKNFSELDITDLVHRYSAEGYKSRYDFINKSYSSGGYVPGQLVVVCAAPSVGKSLFLQSEAVNFIRQGKRVHYLVMGDLNELDLSIRMMCQISQQPQYKIEADIIGNFNLYQDLFKDYLSITCTPSGVVSAREYVDWITSRADEYDILMIDYYSNFKADEDRSMYQSGGDICDALTELVRLGKLVFLAVQPNKSYFGEEYLPYDAIGESSRIAHVADMIITIGRRWDAGMRMGIMNIAKGRRCLADFVPTARWIGTNEGLFYNCSEALYIKYMNNTSQRKLFSYNELITMDITTESIASSLESTLDV